MYASSNPIFHLKTLSDASEQFLILPQRFELHYDYVYVRSFIESSYIYIQYVGINVVKLSNQTLYWFLLIFNIFNLIFLELAMASSKCITEPAHFKKNHYLKC